MIYIIRPNFTDFFIFVYKFSILCTSSVRKEFFVAAVVHALLIRPNGRTYAFVGRS